MTTSDPSIRQAVPDDAEGMARMGVGAYRAAHRGQVPDHLLDTPPLCSYDGHLLDVGKEAARLMGAVLRGEQPAAKRVTPPAQFVCRGTCGSPRGEPHTSAAHH